MAEHVTLQFFEDFVCEFKRFVHIAADQRDISKESLHELRRIRVAVEKLVPKGHMTLKFGEPTTADVRENNSTEDSMPGKETDTQTIPCSEIETDAAGNPVTLDPTSVVWAIDDPSIATLTQNSDGSATFKAVKPVPPAVNPRTANVSCQDTKTGVTGTDQLEVDDSPTVPGKMILTFGTPV
jgi:hypothetical protein